MVRHRGCVRPRPHPGVDHIEKIKTRGVYLNLKPDVSRATQNREFRLHDRDILVLYTDGLTEARNHSGELLDIDQFKAVIQAHAHLPPDVMKDNIIRDVLEWCDNWPADDMTLLIVKKRGQTHE